MHELCFFSLSRLVGYFIFCIGMMSTGQKTGPQLYKPGVGVGSCCLRKEHMPREELHQGIIALTTQFNFRGTKY